MTVSYVAGVVLQRASLQGAVRLIVPPDSKESDFDSIAIALDNDEDTMCVAMCCHVGSECTGVRCSWAWAFFGDTPIKPWKPK